MRKVDAEDKKKQEEFEKMVSQMTPEELEELKKKMEMDACYKRRPHCGTLLDSLDKIGRAEMYEKVSSLAYQPGDDVVEDADFEEENDLDTGSYFCKHCGNDLPEVDYDYVLRIGREEYDRETKGEKNA